MLTRTEVVFHGKGIGRCRLSWNRGKPMRDVELKGISVKSKVNNNAEPLVTGYGVRYKNQNKSNIWNHLLRKNQVSNDNRGICKRCHSANLLIECACWRNNIHKGCLLTKFPWEGGITSNYKKFTPIYRLNEIHAAELENRLAALAINL